MYIIMWKYSPQGIANVLTFLTKLGKQNVHAFLDSNKINGLKQKQIFYDFLQKIKYKA